MKGKLSALLDGDLDAQTTQKVFDELRHTQELKRDWDLYCLIGDTLRDSGNTGNPTDFVAQVMGKLDEQPVLLAPMPAAANRHSRWQALMPIAASVMGVAAVGWFASTLQSGSMQRPPSLAATQTNPTSVVANIVPTSTTLSAAPQSIDDIQQQYLFVHQGVASGPMSGAVQYIRTASDSQQDSHR